MKIDRAHVLAEIARRSFVNFVEVVSPELSLTDFHRAYYSVLDKFARREIRRLIVSMPPQHGKSTAASQLLPAYILGLDPSVKIAIASYNAGLASRFNKQVQRLLDSKTYKTIFAEVKLKSGKAKDSSYVKARDEFDIVGTGGRLISVGREGSLTGNSVDVLIIDDLYKDALEANSPVVRDNTRDWYNSVVRTRMHNDSQELIVFTRWHNDDLIGSITEREQIVDLTDLAQLGNVSASAWVKLNFEAIKTSEPTLIDSRPKGAPLWGERHSLELLEEKRKLDPFVFETMYQGNPVSAEGVLYGGFATYTHLPVDTLSSCNYTDTADTGEDYLCSVCYEAGKDGFIYVTDVVYSRDGMEVTETEVADMLKRNNTRVTRIESNNGGRGFARAVSRLAPDVQVEWFHQSKNKEARILSNSTGVTRFIVMPDGWNLRWPGFFNSVTTYRRVFRANKWHDAADVLTGIIEMEKYDVKQKRIKALGFKSR